MKWHIVCRIGEDDTYLPEGVSPDDCCLVLHFSGGAPNTRVRESVVATIEKQYKAALSGSVIDFLYAAMGAYLADLCIPRKCAQDRWGRELILHVPVFSEAKWRSAGKSLVTALRFLTSDDWTLSTRERSNDAPEAKMAEGPDRPMKACLLSGGLDSLVGAIDLLSEGDCIAFVSHHGGGMTPKFQNSVFDGLRRRYDGQCSENQFYIVPPQLDGEGEDSMRSRSVLFLGLGISVASALGSDVPLVVPENGLISLNVPMTSTRVGSSSTRTTHPYFIAGVRQTLSRLGIKNQIVMPYRHKTKGEMLSEVADSEVTRSLIALTMSCSHPEVARWEGATPGTHCGYCFPCLIRRASVTAASLDDVDAEYTHDVRSKAPTGTRGKDLRAVKMALRRNEQSGRPNFLRVLEAGPLPPDEISEFAEVYTRGMAEISAFLNGAE